MKRLTSFLVCLNFFSFLLLAEQQCRYVTVPVCNNENTSMTIKGEKGERGLFGKAGPKGENGSKGEKGTKGNTAKVEELQVHLSSRLNGKFFCSLK